MRHSSHNDFTPGYVACFARTMPGYRRLLDLAFGSPCLIEEAAPTKMGLLYKVKRRLPLHLTHKVIHRLPHGIQKRLVSVWSASMFDWNTTKYFPMPIADASFLRINLKGREAQRLVEPGAEYEALCDELEADLLSLRDMDTGTPIVN